MNVPVGYFCAVPSRLGVGEQFTLSVRVLGPARELASAGGWCDWKPGLRGPFNLNVQRRIQFMDNCLPEWTGQLEIESDNALDGPDKIVFDGVNQGVYRKDNRPIRRVPGFRWTRPGLHFVRFTDPVSELTGSSNAVHVTAQPPTDRIWWGDPHWQTFFSDGIRCPEELYAFARDEGFLDFGALSDHMEALTDRQWDYFQAVTNDYNDPGRFVTIQGQEWTNHNPDVGAPGHRNVYYRGSGGPVLRSTSPDCNTLEKLWAQLDSFAGIDCLAIPHHSANVIMGVDWEQGWNPKYEKAVEIHSVWGNSERSAADGNPMPIRALKGEMDGRHVVDALRKGYRFGFVGGGDIHDGRPGDDMHKESYPPRDYFSHPEGYTAAFAPALTRENIYDAMKTRRTYASSKSRIYLDVTPDSDGNDFSVNVLAASEDNVKEARLVLNGNDTDRLLPDTDPRVATGTLRPDAFGPQDFCYVRVLTEKGNMAWSSPVWGDELP